MDFDLLIQDLDLESSLHLDRSHTCLSSTKFISNPNLAGFYSKDSH